MARAAILIKIAYLVEPAPADGTACIVCADAVYFRASVIGIYLGAECLGTIGLLCQSCAQVAEEEINEG